MLSLEQFKVPRVKNLDITLVGEIPLEESIVRAIEKSLVISFEMCSAEMIAAWLPKCTNAGTYKFKNCELPPDLEKLSWCTIDIQDCESASVSHLGKYTGLEISVPQITQLQPGSAAHSVFGIFVGGRENQEESISYSYITPEDIAAFNGAQNLYHFGIQYCILTNGVLEVLADINPEHIELYESHLMRGVQFENVQDNSSTISVSVNNSHIPIDVLANFLSAFKNLSSLSLNKLEFRGNDFNLLSNITLKEIDLRECDIFDLSPSKWQIEKVHLRLSQITHNPLLKEVFSESEVEIDDWEL